MKADYVHKDISTSTDYVDLQKENKIIISYNQQLLKENKDLKRQLLSKTLPKDSEDMWITYNLEVNKILQENEKLKEQLANNGIVSTCEKCEWFEICPHSYREFDYKNECEKLKNQQQEFIKYLKSINSFETVGSILKKYKEIIGDLDE